MCCSIRSPVSVGKIYFFGLALFHQRCVQLLKNKVSPKCLFGLVWPLKLKKKSLSNGKGNLRMSFPSLLYRRWAFFFLFKCYVKMITQTWLKKIPWSWLKMATLLGCLFSCWDKCQPWWSVQTEPIHARRPAGRPPWPPPRRPLTLRSTFTTLPQPLCHQ